MDKLSNRQSSSSRSRSSGVRASWQKAHRYVGLPWPYYPAAPREIVVLSAAGATRTSLGLAIYLHEVGVENIRLNIHRLLQQTLLLVHAVQGLPFIDIEGAKLVHRARELKEDLKLL